MERLLADERHKIHTSVQTHDLSEADYRALYLPPEAGSSTAIPTCDHLLQEELMHGRDEPLLVPGVCLGRADERWGSVESLVHHYGHVVFDIVSGTADGRVPLVEFLQYAQQTRATFPLYLVEAQFQGERAQLLQDFTTPEPFRDDVRALVLGGRNPHWFMGGPRSGTFLHVDPRSTSGWNVCVLGAKRWLFLPPDTDLPGAGLPPLHAATAEGGVAAWFLEHAPRLRQLHRQGRLPGFFEAVQRPGDLMFIPCGWMHAVLNLEVSCALGQTLVHACSLPRLWPWLVSKHLDFSTALRQKLRHERPALEALLPSDSSFDLDPASRCGNVGWRVARADAIARAMSTLPLACSVVARDGEHGGGIFSSRECEEGEALLSIPLSACITSRDIPSNHPILSRVGSADSDSFGRGVIALLLALEVDSQGELGTWGNEEKKSLMSRFSAAAYLRAVAPDVMLRWLVMAGWPENSVPAEIVRGSVGWARAKAHKAAMRSEAAALGAAGLKSCQGTGGLAAYEYAQLLVQTRAFKLHFGPVVCPLIDLTNHLSAGCNARTMLEGGKGEGGQPCLVLRATRKLYAGEEVFQNYDADADYSDLFERYGFLDKTANLHTAEVYVPSGFFEQSSDDEKTSNLRSRLVADAAVTGCDESLQAWWVTDFNLLRCPIVAAARLSVVSTHILHAMLQSKIRTNEINKKDSAGQSSFEPEEDWYLFQTPLADKSEEVAALKKLVTLVEAQLQRLADRDCSWELGIRGEALAVVHEDEDDVNSSDDNDTKLYGKDSIDGTSHDTNNCDESECADEAIELACKFVAYEDGLLRGVAAELRRSLHSQSNSTF